MRCCIPILPFTYGGSLRTGRVHQLGLLLLRENRENHRSRIGEGPRLPIEGDLFAGGLIGTLHSDGRILDPAGK